MPKPTIQSEFELRVKAEDELYRWREKAIRRLGLLRRVNGWFKANYSYIYEDESVMQLWADIESDLAAELKDAT